MKAVYRILALCICYSAFTGCDTNKTNFNPDDAELLHHNENKLTEVIIYDVFSPPVASRIYAYTSLAQYEAVRYINADAPSFADKLNGFPKLPVPDKSKQYNFILAGTKAFCTVAYNVRIFSADTLHRYEDSVYALYKNALSEDVYNNSIAFGETIGEAILARAKKDMYKETRGMPKYLGYDEDGKWKPTAPDYLDGAEAYWKLIKPFTLDTSSVFRPAAPFAFDKDSSSAFYKMVSDVYNTAVDLTDEQKTIARYWDDNPFVVEHSGHMMFGNKKITPGGHWMGITAIACRQKNADAVETAKAYSLTSMSLLDAFISCWDAKYAYEYVRPITVVNEWFNKEWDPFLQTPAFPEYTSGHSTISASAATVLTYMFGDGFAFHDNSDSAYIGMTRDFTSFRAAADEASISRFYGGIHYRPSLDTGLVCGAKVGANVLKKLGLQ